MRCAVFALTILLLATAVASALDYEKKPEIIAYVYGSNCFERGDEKNLMLVIFNTAYNEKIEYADLTEAGFFNGREDMLFTAYDIKVNLEGNDYVKVKTPEQRIPALRPMSPLNLNFLISISDNAKAGEYELKLNIEYYRINDLKNFIPITVENPEQKSYTVIDNTNRTNTTVVVVRHLTKEYELEYIKETETIPVKIYIEEKPVRLAVLSVEEENLIGQSKGRIKITVRNEGDKTARNAYIVLDTPSRIEAKSLSLGSAQSPAGLAVQPVPSLLPGFSPAMVSPETTSLSSAKAAYYIGDLKPGETATATFYLKLNVKEGGTYPLQIKAVYFDEFGEQKESESTTFGINVSDAPKITVKDVESKVYVNAKGEVRVTLVSDKEMSDATVRISANSPLSVLSSEYYIGDIKSGEEFTAVFKLKASSEAKAVTYPAEIRIIFRSLDEYVELDPVRIGVKVNPKMEFEVQGIPSIAAGEEKVVTFFVKNLGDFEVRDATARITIISPFSSTDDSAFIGNLKPGETANATFKLSVDSEATPKLYALNLEVKYKDPEGEWAYSEPAKAIINVTPARPPYALYAVVALIILAAIIYYLRRR